MKIGYARVSSDGQRLDLQINALREAGCERIFTDEISGATVTRPALTKLLSEVESGDQVVVWRLDRLGRSLQHLIELVQNLGKRGINVKSLSEALDTSTPGGELIFHVMGALAQYERELIRERTRAGMAAARARGAPIGRPRVMTDDQVAKAQTSLKSGSTRQEVASKMGISISTLYRELAGSRA